MTKNAVGVDFASRRDLKLGYQRRIKIIERKRIHRFELVEKDLKLEYQRRSER